MSDDELGRAAAVRFGENLRAVREFRGWGQDRLAEAMTERGHSWHQSTVYKIESAQRKVSFFEAEALAEILGVTTDRFTWQPPEAGEVALVDRAIVMIREAWHETSDAAMRLQSSLKSGGRVLKSAEKSKYQRVRQAAVELRSEIETSSVESAAGDGLARYENQEE